MVYPAAAFSPVSPLNLLDSRRAVRSWLKAIPTRQVESGFWKQERDPVTSGRSGGKGCTHTVWWGHRWLWNKKPLWPALWYSGTPAQRRMSSKLPLEIQKPNSPMTPRPHFHQSEEVRWSSAPSHLDLRPLGHRLPAVVLRTLRDEARQSGQD